LLPIRQNGARWIHPGRDRYRICRQSHLESKGSAYAHADDLAHVAHYGVRHLAVVASTPAGAQQTPGACAPDGTRTIDGSHIPAPAPAFDGVINMGAPESKPCWPASTVPPKGAPNVLLIMTDDAGYGVSSTFGSIIPTPAMDRIAKMGLRYTQFHSTALCSPTRAALITGRNHHSVGFRRHRRAVDRLSGYDAVIGSDNATIGTILRDNGYATSWFGKNHNTPELCVQHGRPVRPVAQRNGLRVFLWLHGRRDRPVVPYLFRDHSQVYP
jgi:arylsulfatase